MVLKFAMEMGAVSLFSSKEEKKPFVKLSFNSLSMLMKQRPTSSTLNLNLQYMVHFHYLFILFKFIYFNSISFLDLFFTLE